MRTGTIPLAKSCDFRPASRGTAGVRKNSAWPPTCGILPHSGKHADTEFTPNSPAVSRRPRSQARRLPGVRLFVPPALRPRIVHRVVLFVQPPDIRDGVDLIH